MRPIHQSPKAVRSGTHPDHRPLHPLRYAAALTLSTLPGASTHFPVMPYAPGEDAPPVLVTPPDQRDVLPEDYSTGIMRGELHIAFVFGKNMLDYSKPLDEQNETVRDILQHAERTESFTVRITDPTKRLKTCEVKVQVPAELRSADGLVRVMLEAERSFGVMGFACDHPELLPRSKESSPTLKNSPADPQPPAFEYDPADPAPPLSAAPYNIAFNAATKPKGVTLPATHEGVVRKPGLEIGKS